MSSKRAAQWGWALSAWANHAYITTVIVGLFPIFFDKYRAAALPGAQSTFYLGLTNSAASLAVMLAAPWLGALADRRGRKKRWFAVCTVLGACASAALALIGHDLWVVALVVYALGSIGYWAGSSFQDALIVQVAVPAEANRVSSFGFALGYLGGGLLFLCNMLLVLHPQSFHLPNAAAATRVAFVDVALWWLLFTLPLMRTVPEAPPTAQSTTWRELRATVARVMRDAPVRNFLLAYWLYMDGIGTLQQMAVDFGTKLGFSTNTLIQALLLVQFISFPCALAFGWLGDRIGARRAIYLGLITFTGLTVYAYFMQTERQMYVLAAVLGMVQGGVQALSRSFFVGLIPAERAGEYFGFYNMLAKFAAVLGPVAMGLVAVLTRNQRLSMLVLSLFFVGGVWLLARVDTSGRERLAI